MRVIDLGHIYEMATLDGYSSENHLVFVKREGQAYPGNVGHHPGVIIQEVLRCCLDRLRYVNKQIPCTDNLVTQMRLEEGIWRLERRAAIRHGRDFTISPTGIDHLPVCEGCGYIGCDGGCMR